MFRAFLIAAGLVLALGTLSPAEAARSRSRAAATEATTASTEAPAATTSRRARRAESRAQHRARGEASYTRRNRGAQHASARRTPRSATTQAPTATQ